MMKGISLHHQSFIIAKNKRKKKKKSITRNFLTIAALAIPMKTIIRTEDLTISLITNWALVSE